MNDYKSTFDLIYPQKDRIENGMITTGGILEFERDLSINLIVKGKGWSYGFIFFGEKNDEINGRARIIVDLLNTLGVEKLNQLEGFCVRVKFKWNDNSPFAVGHIIEDNWMIVPRYFID